MDSANQLDPTPKQSSRIGKVTFVLFILFAVGLAVLNHSPQWILPALVLLAWIFALTPQQRIVGIGAFLAVLILLGMAVETKDHNPVLSSSSLLSALFVSLGSVAVVAVPRMQLFLYKHGYRTKAPYIDGFFVEGGYWSNGHGNWSDGGGCGGDSGGSCGDG